MKNIKISNLKEDEDCENKHTRIHMRVKIEERQAKMFEAYIKGNRFVTCIYSIKGNYNFVFEAVFRNTIQIHNFMEEIESKFTIISKDHYLMHENLKEEHGKSEFTIRYVKN